MTQKMVAMKTGLRWQKGYMMGHTLNRGYTTPALEWQQHPHDLPPDRGRYSSKIGLMKKVVRMASMLHDGPGSHVRESRT